MRSFESFLYSMDQEKSMLLNYVEAPEYPEKERELELARENFEYITDKADWVFEGGMAALYHKRAGIAGYALAAVSAVAIADLAMGILSGRNDWMRTAGDAIISLASFAPSYALLTSRRNGIERWEEEFEEDSLTKENLLRLGDKIDDMARTYIELGYMEG
jgi:hypothetical protein